MHISEKLFNATDGGRDIILELLDNKARQLAERGKNFCYGPNDKNPSCSLYKNKDHIWILHDHGGDIKGGNAITVYAEHYSMDWTDALLKLCTIYHILDPKSASAWGKPDYKSRAPQKGEQIGWYELNKRDFIDTDYTTLFATKAIDFCKQTLIDDGKGGKHAYTKRMADTMKLFNFIAVDSYSFCSDKDGKPVVHTFTATPEYPIYVYDMGTWAKVYQPFARDKSFRFLHLGKKPEQYIFGWDALVAKYKALVKSNEDRKTAANDSEGKAIPNAPAAEADPKLKDAFIVTGGSDAMNLAVFGYDVLFENSETGKAFTVSKFKSLKDMCENVYNIPDLDATGRKTAHELALMHLDLKTLKLPKELAERRDHRGGKCKDVKDFFKYYDKTRFETLRRNALPYRFWDEKPKYNHAGDKIGTTYECNNTQLYNFLMGCGFYQFKANNGKTDMFIKITGNIVEEINPKDIRGFVNSFLEQRNFVTELRNVFFKTTQLNSTSMENLGYIELEFKTYSKHNQYFFFEDCTIEVTAKGIIQHSPGDVDVYTWKDHVIKHKLKNRLKPSPFEIVKTDDGYHVDIKHRHCLFFRYVENTTKMHWRVEKQGVEQLAEGVKTIRTEYTPEELEEHNKHLLNRLFTIGYQLHRYKAPSRAWAVWSQENQVIEENSSEGGSGKSILANSFKYLLKQITIGARDPRIADNKHLFENVDEKTDMVHFDDTSKYFPFSLYFPRVTGDFDVNPKNNKQFTLPFEQSPKLYISSNYAPRDADGSTLRRILFTVFSDYFHHGPTDLHATAWSPRDEFGKELFRDFTDTEWEYFFSFMMSCLQFYLACDDNEKLDPPRNVIEQRSLMAGMVNNFLDWAITYFSADGEMLNKEVPKKQALQHFNEYANTKVAMQSFTSSLKNFCKFQGYVYNPEDKLTDKKNKRIIRNEHGSTVEMFYIQTKAIDTPPAEPTTPAPPPPPKQQDLPFTAPTQGDDIPF